MTAPQTQFVINEKGGDIAVVHDASCGFIQHQVTQQVRAEDGGFEYEYVGVSEDGHDIVLERRRTSVSHYTPRFITVAELIKLKRKYRRCQHCAPDVPESPRSVRPDVTQMKARSIGAHRLGRDFVGVGPLLAVRMSASGYELIGEKGSLLVPLDGSVEYRKPRPTEPPST